MGSGKTTFGKKLASKMNYQFIDLDELIEKRVDMRINEIFKKYGEDVFRQLETSALRSTARKENVVISTGGGTPCHNENMSWINKNGVSVFLGESNDSLFSRLRLDRDHRPLIRNFNDDQLQKFIDSTLLERNKYYKKAHHKINSTESPDSLIQLIEADLLAS